MTTRGDWPTRIAISRLVLGAVGLLVVVCPRASALDPSLDVSQYAHTAWKVREGFSKGNIYSIAQTPDGYLWLATELGTLLRFDGVRTLLWQPPTPKHVMTIHTARDGALWIGSEDGLASWKNGVLTEYKEFEGYRVSAISEDREGTVWVGIAWNPGGRMCSVRGGKVQCYGTDGSLGRYVRSLCDDGDLLWVYAETGLWQWKPAPVRMSQVQKPEGWHLSNMACVNDPGHSLIALPEGIQQVVNGKIISNPLPNLPKLSDTTSMLRDRDGGLWIGTVSHGLVHIHQGRTDRFTRSDGLSGDDVIALLEDREGNLWVLTRDGLDRFREFAIPTISVSQGLSTSRVWSVLGARDGSVWIGSNDALHRLSNGQITVYPKGHGLGDYSGSLFEDDRGRIWISTSRGLTYFSNGRFTRLKEQISGQVHSITEDTAGRLWFSEDFEGHQSIGSLLGGGLIERIPRSRLGLKESTIILSADSLRGGLWIGAEDGLAYFKDGLVQKLYTSADGLPPVNDIYLDGEGTVWAGTDSGLVRLRDGRLATLTTRNGLPCNHVSWVREDDDHSFWLLLRCGLARIPRSDLGAWAADTNRTISATIFDNPDGVQVRWSPSYGYAPIVTKSKDGRLWFTNWDGVSVFDPRRLLRNELPPPVHIEQIAANGRVYWQNLTGAASSKPQLPPRIHDLEIEFTALSLALPEKVRFRYKLDGQDPDWKEVIKDRKVQYSNLAPGNYRFRVTACNNSGVWNEEGTFLDFSIAPAYYQTNWFRALCAAAFLAVLWGLYQSRIQQLRRQERKLRDVIETIPTFAWTASPDGAVDFINHHWVEYTGLSREKTMGAGWKAAVHPEDLPPYLEKQRASVASGEPFEHEVRFRRAADGAYHWFLNRGVPLRDSGGKILKWYGISTDIEDRKRAENERERLRQIEADLAHINRVSTLGEMAASLAHEIKQPIAAAITSANSCIEWLAHEPPNLDRARAAASRIDKYGNRATEIIDRIRSLYKKSPPQRELVDMNGIIQEMLALLKGEADGYSVAMRTELATELPKIMADPVQLQQVFMNLMLNAIEAMNDSGGDLTVKSALQDGQLQFSVSDTGVGLPTEKMDQIFSAFFTTKPQGSGMGLAISRSIVESHGGHLWASANSGGGATFHFTLPIQVTESSPLVA